MNQIKILICDENRGVLSEYKSFLEDKNAVVYICPKNGEKLLETINSRMPDVVITDLFLSHIDGLAAAEIIRKRDFRPSLLFALSAVDTENIVAMSISSGFDYFFLKPCSVEVIYDKILLMLNLKKESNSESAAVNLLYDLGIPAHLTGYNYIKTAVELSCENPAILNNMTGALYPAVAEHYQTKASRVERSIRTAIEITCTKGNKKKLRELFPYHFENFERPTNSEFISTLTEYIKVKSILRTKYK